MQESPGTSLANGRLSSRPRSGLCARACLHLPRSSHSQGDPCGYHQPILCRRFFRHSPFVGLAGLHSAAGATPILSRQATSGAPLAFRTPVEISPDGQIKTVLDPTVPKGKAPAAGRFPFAAAARGLDPAGVRRFALGPPAVARGSRSGVVGRAHLAALGHEQLDPVLAVEVRGGRPGPGPGPPARPGVRWGPVVYFMPGSGPPSPAAGAESCRRPRPNI